MRQIPVNRLANTLLEASLRLPTQLAAQLGAVGPIAKVMALAVLDKLHLGVRVSLLTRLTGKLVDQRNHDLRVLALITSTDVVNLAYAPALEHRIERTTVVGHVDPIADVAPIAIQGNRLIRERLGDDQWHQLLRMLVGAVVVAAARDNHRQAVGIRIGHGVELGTRLASAVGIARRQQRRLLETRNVLSRRQRAVNLVRADLQEDVIAIAAVRLLPIVTRSREQGQNTLDIGAVEGKRVLERAVDMAFRRKVHHIIRAVFTKDSIERPLVADIGMHENVTRMVG